MKTRKVKKNNITKLFQILLFTTIIVACYSLSKFYNASAGKATAILGQPIATTTLEEIILEDLKPSETKKYKFKVSNYKNDKISDIDMTYTLQIKSERYLPINFELKKLENNIPTGENLLKNNITEKINMGKEKYEQEYELSITWDEKDKNYKYSKEIDYVEIVLNSYQEENI